MQKHSRVLRKICSNVGEYLKLTKLKSRCLKEDSVEVYHEEMGWGGFYDHLVNSVKTPLKKIFAKAILDAGQLTTILDEIETQLNSRPLTYLSADPGDYSVITPVQILIGRNLQASPAKDTHVTEHTSRTITKSVQYQQRLVNDFGSIGMLST